MGWNINSIYSRKALGTLIRPLAPSKPQYTQSLLQETQFPASLMGTQGYFLTYLLCEEGIKALRGTRENPAQGEGSVKTTANNLETQHGDPTLPGVTKKLGRLQGIPGYTEMV